MGQACAGCQKDLAGSVAYQMPGAHGQVLKCTRCAVTDRGMLRRSAVASLLMTSALIALNQGDTVLAGTFSWSSNWYKIPLTYALPFCVATYGALSNGRRPV